MKLIQLNYNRLWQDLSKYLRIEINALSKILIQYMVYHIGQIPIAGSVDAVGKPDWRADIMTALNFTAITKTAEVLSRIGISNQNDDMMMKAMIVEFGMGTAADMGDNPWIQDYLSSQFYHSERGGMQVMGRKGKLVYDIDMNSWVHSTASHNEEIEHFRQIGSKFWTKIFGSASKIAETDLHTAIDNAFYKINLSKYVEIR